MTEVMTSLLTSLLIFLAIEWMDMGKDTTAFRERFEDYKNGKPVSEIYDAGLPRYNRGKWAYTPSNKVRKHIAKWEGADFTKQNALFGGDAIGAKAKEFTDIMTTVGANLTLDELDGLFSTFYNLSPKTYTTLFMPVVTNYANNKTWETQSAMDSKLRNRYTLSKKIYQNGIKRRAAADVDLMGLRLTPPIKPEVPDALAVRLTIPAEQTKATWSGVKNASPYVTGRPMIKLAPRTELPDLIEMLEDSEYKPPFQLTPPRYKKGKLPGYKDGTRYLWDEQEGGWDRITDNEYARAFADFTATPKGNRLDIRTNPVYHDPRLKNAGYVTEEMLEGESNSAKLRETSSYAPGLESVYPEFDLLGLSPILKEGIGIIKLTGKQIVNNAFSKYTIPNNINFIRNVGAIPEVDANGMFWLSPEDRALTNMTWDKSFRTHRHYKSRPGTEYLVIPPRLLKDKQFISTDPMDTFLLNTKVPANGVTLISGNPEMRELAKVRGFNVASSAEIDNAYLKFSKLNDEYVDEAFNSSNGSIIDLRNLNIKNPLRGSLEIIDYDNAVNNYIQQEFGKPNILDALKLRINTNINPHVRPILKLNYNNAPAVEYNILKKYGIPSHPTVQELPSEVIQLMLRDLNSRPFYSK